MNALTRDPLVSIIVPVLDEVRALPGLLEELASLPGRFETLIADGGSRDGTPDLARAHPLAPVVIGPIAGRAAQLNEAAAAANGEALVFLHADSRLPRTAYSSLAAALRRPAVIGGNFDLRFDGGDRFSSVMTRWYAIQTRAGIYYGDSTIWTRAATFRALGGYRPLPIMDDYDFARRLERAGRTERLPGPATTSARRWKALGAPRTAFSWTAIRWLYLAGVSPDRLARLYRAIR